MVDTHKMAFQKMAVQVEQQCLIRVLVLYLTFLSCVLFRYRFMLLWMVASDHISAKRLHDDITRLELNMMQGMNCVLGRNAK